MVNNLVTLFKSKIQSITMTALIAIGCGQFLLGTLFDAVFLGVGIGIVWLSFKVTK